MTNELTESGRVHCANCSTPMEGEFCHHCGQSIHSVLKPVHHMLEDGMDMFLHVDGRILHTLPPLFTRPGFLTLEYFAGRRQRYVAPFRLMFVLCLLTFFAFHLAMNTVMHRMSSDPGGTLVLQEKAPFADDASAQDVHRDLDEALRGLRTSRDVAPIVPGVAEGLAIAENKLRDSADQRLAELGAPPLSRPSAEASAETPREIATDATPSEKPAVDRYAPSTGHHKTRDLVNIGWLPDFVNARLDAFTVHVRANLEAALQGQTAEIRQDARERVASGFFSVLPQSMLVMIPLFALLLKIFYVFRRRLYMEHVIVALHSHAFLFIALLLTALTGMLSTWLGPHAAWTRHLFGLIQCALWIWMFAYLLIMQKRIYRQGWAMTVLKYWCVGWCYFWLLTAVLGCALVLGAGH